MRNQSFESKNLIELQESGQLNREHLMQLLSLDDFTPVYELADEVRRKTVGDEVHIRAIIEFSNICARQCKYCGLNCNHEGIDYYQMTADEILSTAERAIRAGYKTIVLQSGENPKLNRRWMGHVIKHIVSMGAVVTLSIGELSREELEFYRQCGAQRYLLKHETADPHIYEELHPCGTLEERVECLRNIKDLGYETGSGFMVGLPGQTLETIADDLLLLRELGCRMAGIGPFIPHPDTPLRDAEAGSPELTRRAVALTRLLIPDANLPVTTALGVVERENDTGAAADHGGAAKRQSENDTGGAAKRQSENDTGGAAKRQSENDTGDAAKRQSEKAIDGEVDSGGTAIRQIENAFACGANVVMKKVTPDEYKEAYEIYPAQLDKTDIEKDRKLLEDQIRALGRIPV